MSEDLIKVLLGSLSAVVTGFIGVAVARIGRPYGHRLERLWELRAKAPEDDAVARAYLDEEVGQVISDARLVKYRAAVLVLQIVLSFAVFVAIPNEYNAALARGFGFGLGKAAGGNLPDRLVTVIAVALFSVYIAVILAVLQAAWTVARHWYRIARSWGASKLLLRTLIGLCLLLIVLVCYASRHHR